jgi:hypothetical protein
MADIAAGSRAEEEAAVTGDATIRPFRIGFPKAGFTELRRRINATRWPGARRSPTAGGTVPRAILVP